MDFENQLARALYRFDCPSPHTLGEYSLDLVPQTERTAIARHTLACVECTAELRDLRVFMSTDPPVAATLAGRARRVLADLVSSPNRRPAFAFGLRDAQPASATIYRVEDVSISLVQGPEPGELTGMVARDVTGPETVVGADVSLVDADGARRVATIGPAGDFRVAALGSGIYQFELRLPDRVVVIADVRFDPTWHAPA